MAPQPASRASTLHLLLLALVLCPQLASAAPFGFNSLAVVRLNDGTAMASASTTVNVFVDEIDATSGALLQSFAVPTHLSAYASNALDTGAASDTCAMAFTVYETPKGSTSPSVTGANTFNRVAVRLSDLGVFNVSSNVVKFSSGYSARGIAINGSGFTYMVRARAEH